MTMRIGVAALLIFQLTVSFACAQEHASTDPPIVRGNTAFALELYFKLKERKGNLCFSPYSISSALALTYAGAKGDTAREMSRVLHLPGANTTHTAFATLNSKFEGIQKDGKVQLTVANSLWPQKGYPFLPEFLTLMKRDYGVTVTPVDYVSEPYAARKTINNWVEARTNGKIINVLQRELSKGTLLTLINAIYFKGSWAKRFDPTLTAESDFWLRSGVKTRALLMHQYTKLPYAETDDVQILELPYQGQQLSMVIILPKAHKRLSGLENEFSPENLSNWLGLLQKTDVRVYLPKFKMSPDSYDLIKPMQVLGMRKAFASEADFSGMNGRRDISISNLLHKAFVEVNEEGTEAAAATVATFALTGRPRNVTFRADHPFLFAIRERSSGSLLFLGRVVEP